MGMYGESMLSTTGAASGFWKIWIFNRKAASCWRIDKVDFCTAEVRIEFPLRGEHDIVEVIFRIDGGIEHSIEVEGVMHSTASAAEDTDP